MIAQSEGAITRTILSTIQVGSTVDSLIATGGYFTVNFVVANGAVGSVITIYRSEDGQNWTVNTPQATCTLDGNKVCSILTDHLSYFASIKETTTSG
jgi:predicted methyltransferase